jgi:hypothetical protein
MPTFSMQPQNAIFSKYNYSTNFNNMKTKIILILIFTFFSVKISAQNSPAISENTSMEVIELNSFLSAPSGMQRQASSSTVSSLNVQNVRDLIYNTQPSIYYYSGVVKTYGEKPKNLFTDINSLNNLNSAILLKNNIEIITIKLENSNQLNTTINLGLFSSFKNLKYIYILSSIETTSEAITNMISGSDDKYSIFYKLDKGDNNQ